jgi:tetratricopeptide (TPR) repeat protein
LADFYARAGVPARARDFLRRYESERTDKQRADTSPGQYEVIGAIAVAERRYDDALTTLHRRREKNPACTMCRLFEIGEVHDAAGRPDSAIVYYERFLSTPTLFRLGWDAGYRWLIFRRLGELYEARGDRTKAADYYGRLLKLWSSADPDLQPIVQDVTGRLEKLVREQ